MQKNSIDQICKTLGLKKGIKYKTSTKTFVVTDNGFEDENGILPGGDVMLISTELLYKKHWSNLH